MIETELNEIINTLKHNKGNHEIIDDCLTIIEDITGFEFVPILEEIGENLHSNMSDDAWNTYLDDVKDDILNFIN